MSRFIAEMKKYSAGKPYYCWRLLRANGRSVVASGEQCFDRPGKLEDFLGQLFGNNELVEVAWHRAERPVSRR